MTEGQIRYQTLMENQRHNYEVEAFNAKQAANAAVQAQASIMQAKAATRNAETNRREQVIKKMQLMLDVERYPQEYELRRQTVKSQTIKNAADTVESGAKAWNTVIKTIGQLALFL